MDKTEDALFKLLENSSEEPLLRIATEEALELNIIFEQEGDRLIDEDEMSGLVQKLDENVVSLREKTATVTGFVYYAEPNRGVQRNGDPIISRQWVNGVPIVFNGFAIDRNLPNEIYDDDEQDVPSLPLPSRLLKVMYHGKASLSALRDIPPGDYGDESFRNCSFELDSIIKFDEMSADRAAAFLEASYPKLIEEIDVRILQTENETEAVLSLRDLTIETPELDEEENLELKAALGAYLNFAITYDKDVPYLLNIRGNVIVRDKNGEFKNQELDRGHDSKAIYYIDALRVITHNIKGEQPKLAIYAEVRFINDDISTQPIKLSVHIEAINTLVSIRREMTSDSSDIPEDTVENNITDSLS